MIITINKCIFDNVYFHEPVKNSIIDGEFIKVYYATDFFSLNGIYLYIPNDQYKTTVYYQTQDKSNSNIMFNNDFAQYMCNIETEILKKVCILNKNPVLKLSEQLNSTQIRLYSKKDDFTSILLKISGIWTNSTHYGITYKFTPLIN